MEDRVLAAFLDPYLTDWLNLLIRWLHVIAAIAWIGASFYFVLLDQSLRRVTPPFDGKITYGPQGGHGFRKLSEQELLAEMAEAIEKGRK